MHYPDAGAYALDLRQHPRDRIRWLGAALAAARRLKDRAVEGAHLGNLGTAFYAMGEARRAIEFYEQRLVNAREIGDRRGEGVAVFNISHTLDQLGDRAQAIAHAVAALEILEQIELPYVERVRAQIAEWRGQG
jgi:tetratricopeptide (TPR) repeat protein